MDLTRPLRCFTQFMPLPSLPPPSPPGTCTPPWTRSSWRQCRWVRVGARAQTLRKGGRFVGLYSTSAVGCLDLKASASLAEFPRTPRGPRHAVYESVAPAFADLPPPPVPLTPNRALAPCWRPYPVSPTNPTLTRPTSTTTTCVPPGPTCVSYSRPPSLSLTLATALPVYSHQTPSQRNA